MFWERCKFPPASTSALHIPAPPAGRPGVLYQAYKRLGRHKQLSDVGEDRQTHLHLTETIMDLATPIDIWEKLKLWFQAFRLNFMQRLKWSFYSLMSPFSKKTLKQQPERIPVSLLNSDTIWRLPFFNSLKCSCASHGASLCSSVNILMQPVGSINSKLISLSSLGCKRSHDAVQLRQL